MAKSKEELFQQLSDAVVDMEDSTAVDVSKEVIGSGYSAFEAINQGLADGMKRAGDLFEEEEYFVPELLMCTEAMNAGIEVLAPFIEKDALAEKKKVVIGVVQGDTHDIGKNLVGIMLEASGFEIFDLGRDITPKVFVEKAKEVKADIIALSTLMTTTMSGMEEVIELLKEENIRDQFKVVIGGGPVSQNFANKIGADGYSTNASDAVRLLRQLTMA
ncbi:MAG TPA: corrinoid protein [Desulfosporosinus sp.]|nr:corrinoid protein [Desulfosporosinus sp.]